MLRRVKSFSQRKTIAETKSTDVNANITPGQGNPKVRKKALLLRKKSMSTEALPLRIELESNDLFNRQKARLEKLEYGGSATRPKTAYKRENLVKRESLSLDETKFSHYIYGGAEASSVWKVNNEISAEKKRNRHKTVDITRDLINQFEHEPADGTDSSKKPGNFPVHDEDQDVQVRNHEPLRHGRPKTYTPTMSKKKDETFDVAGPFKLVIGQELCLSIRSMEFLRLTSNGHLQLLDGGRNHRETIKTNAFLKKGAKVTDKTHVEMTDIYKTNYVFQFPSEKQVKSFVEMDRTRTPPIEKIRTSPMKPAGGFSLTQVAQFLGLMKKRSSRDLLELKGIIRNEPIFGNTLRELCDPTNPVPEVVRRTVELIEKPENIVSEGIYRVSPNLAVVQNIRFDINSGKWDTLYKYEKEVDVLTGTLKLFFRELKEPLIPWEVVERFLKVIKKQSASADETRQIINTLPLVNKETLLFILKHLVNLCQHKHLNRMDFHNVSICWGPSLIAFPENCTELVAYTSQFTKITEHLLKYVQCTNDAKQPLARQPDAVFDVVQKLTELIDVHLETEGIYRKSGSSIKIDKIVKLMKNHDVKSVNNWDISKNDVHDLCCALKKYLSSLSEPLVPDKFFQRYCDICDQSDDNSLKEKLRRMMETIPRKDVLRLLLRHLNNVVRHEKKNKMSVATMSDIWMMTLAANNAPHYKKKTKKFSKLFQILLDLDDSVMLDVIQTRASDYDNVPDDIRNEADILDDRLETKL